MQALNIRWRAGRRPFTATGLLLAVAGLLSAAWVALDWQDAATEWQQLQARQARLARAAQTSKRTPAAATSVATSASASTSANANANASASPSPSGTAPLPREDAQSAAQIDAQLQRPWDALLHSVEQSQVKDVALISLDVQAAASSLHLVGEAKDMDHALAYVKQLSRSPSVQKVYLSGQEEKQNGAQKVLRFSLDASWVQTP